MSRKKRIISVCLAGVLGVVVYTTYQSLQQEEVQVLTKETTVERGDLTVGITESGSTTLGTVEQTFDNDLSGESGSSESLESSGSSNGFGGNMAEMTTMGAGAGAGTSSGSNTSSTSDNALEVEEVYVAVGQVVEKGDSLMKLTKESIANARTELQQTVNSAELELKNAKIERKHTKIAAEYEYKENVAKGKTAKIEYNATLKSLEDDVENAQEAVEEAKARIKEIPKEIKKLQQKKKTIKASGETVIANSNTYSNEQETNMEQGGSMKQGTNLEQEKTSSSAMNTTISNDTTTVSGINEQISALQSELTSVKNNYSGLVSGLSQAKNAQTTGKISAKEAYDEAVLNYENAQEIYDIAMDGIDDTVEDAQASLEDAKESLEEFNDFVGDGVIQTEYAGTILSLGYDIGDFLSSDTAIVTYADAESVDIVVSVSQEDISNVAIDDVVNVAFTAYEEERYSAIVTGITNSETSSNSSTVNYDVTVNVQGDVSKIYEGMTANVTFVTKELKDVVYVSNKAIIREGTKSYVKKLENGATTKIEVTTGFSNGSMVEIQSGLEEEDVVLIESQVSGS